MHCHCGTNNRSRRWTFTDPRKPEVRSGAREESASPAWLATPAMNALDTTKVYIWRLCTGCVPTLYRKCHSQNTPGKWHNNTWVEPLAGNYTKCKIQKNWRNWWKEETKNWKWNDTCPPGIEPVILSFPIGHLDRLGYETVVKQRLNLSWTRHDNTFTLDYWFVHSCKNK